VRLSYAVSRRDLAQAAQLDRVDEEPPRRMVHAAFRSHVQIVYLEYLNCLFRYT
jgi:hypothetical protein